MHHFRSSALFRLESVAESDPRGAAIALLIRAKLVWTSKIYDRVLLRRKENGTPVPLTHFI